MEPRDRDQLRSQILQLLDEWNQLQPVPVAVQNVAQELGQNGNIVFNAIRYLAEKGLVQHIGEIGGFGLVQITSAGQDVVTYPQNHRNDPGVGSTATYIINNQGGTIGQQQVGGTGNTQSGNAWVQAIHHAHADELQSAISRLKTALAQDMAFDPYRKEEAEITLSVIEGELNKPEAQQDKGRLAYRAKQLVGLVAGATAFVDLADAIHKLLVGG